MKHIFKILMLIALPISLFSQAPQKMSYQAVIRNTNGQLISNSLIGTQVSIRQISPTGVVIYRETHSDSTNTNGLISLEIGSGSIISGSFSSIDWNNGGYYIQIQTDPNGGTNYTLDITTQLVSVPYAFHSNTSDSLTGNLNEQDPIFSNSVAFNITSQDISTWNNKLDIELDGSITNELQMISISGDTISLDKGGNSILLPTVRIPPLDSVLSSGNNANGDSILNLSRLLMGAGNLDSSAIIQINDTSSGFLLPRLSSSQMNAILSPAEGLMVYNLTDSALFYYNGMSWLPSSTTTQSIGGGNIPVGTVISFAGDSSSIPNGYLLCDGRSLPTANYNELFTVIGYDWGGSGNTFRLPDLRGRFLRGTDYGAGTDPDTNLRISLYSGGNNGNKVGSYQSDTIGNHRHELRPGEIVELNILTGVTNNKGVPSGSSLRSQAVRHVGFEGGNETRPKNANVNFIIRFSSNQKNNIVSLKNNIKSDSDNFNPSINVVEQLNLMKKLIKDQQRQIDDLYKKNQILLDKLEN